MHRKAFTREVETEVLVRSKRRCALCFGFDGDLEQKKGQIAHIDRNPANARKENAAFLCMPHHDEYDTTPSQSKGITPDELKTHLASLYEALLAPGVPSRSVSNKKRIRGTRGRVSLPVYDRRLPMYKTTVEFIRTVTSDLRPDLKVILRFAADTEEALFLFDAVIADYLAQLFRRALRVRAISLTLEKNGWADSLGQEEAELSGWFSEQIEETRRKFAPFLQIAP